MWSAVQLSLPSLERSGPSPTRFKIPSMLRPALLMPAAYGVIAGIVSWLIINGADFIIVWTLRKMGRNPRTDTGIQEDVSPVCVDVSACSLCFPGSGHFSICWCCSA